MDLREILCEGLNCGLNSSGSGLGLAVRSCEHDNETSDSIKREEFLERLSDCQLLKEDILQIFILRNL